MKSGEFSRLLVEYSELLAAAGSNQKSDLGALATLFELKPTKSVRDVCKVIQSDGAALSAELEGTSIRSLVPTLDALATFLDPIAKKPADDVGVLVASLLRFEDSSLRSICSGTKSALLNPGAAGQRGVRAANPAVVSRHLLALETAFGDERMFDVAFRDLKNDPAVTATEAKELAKLFTKGVASSKDKALKAIWSRHASLMESRAKAAATDGRTAA